MYMYDPKLGEMDVELSLGTQTVLPSVVSGYYVDTFEELDEDALDYLNEKYEDEIVAMANELRKEQDNGQEKLLH